ncbi:MAG: hypothetical protein EBU66_18065 [Bacteroidetes bacterium]|nr:hypothetical protein [bacterium]NBP66538.1 hypothetical protein [Bacteroidota bacterium]
MDSQKNEQIENEQIEEDEVAWFNRKYPNASCHRCDKKLNGDTVVECGGGGDCQMWYCETCYEQGTDDCPVCNDCRSDSDETN